MTVHKKHQNKEVKTMIKEYQIFNTKKLTIAIHDGKICMDKKGLWNKKQHCPVQLPYPKTPDEIRQFIEAIEWISTKEALDISMHIDFKKFKTKYIKFKNKKQTKLPPHCINCGKFMYKNAVNCHGQKDYHCVCGSSLIYNPPE